jgi:hypothetical protein
VNYVHAINTAPCRIGYVADHLRQAWWSGAAFSESQIQRTISHPGAKQSGRESARFAVVTAVSTKLF